jgi:hypothetical protein
MLCAAASAYNSTIPVNVKVNVEFLSKTHFILFMPNGLEKHYDWSNTSSNVTPPDDSFTHTVYATLDPQQWCGENTALYQYQNLTSTFASLTGICSSSMTQYNKTVAALSDAAASDKALVTCSSQLNATQVLLASLRAKETTFDNTMSDYLSCQTGYANCKADQEKLATCTTDLDKSNSDKTTYALGAAAGGLLIGWFLWKRKKPAQTFGPTEQGGMAGSDFVNVDSSRMPPRRNAGIKDDVWKKFEGDGGNE